MGWFKVFGGLCLLLCTTLLLFLLMPIVGAISGYIVSLFFDETVRSTLQFFGVDLGSTPLWQVGLTLAFIGSFFKASVHHSQK